MQSASISPKAAVGMARLLPPDRLAAARKIADVLIARFRGITIRVRTAGGYRHGGW